MGRRRRIRDILGDILISGSIGIGLAGLENHLYSEGIIIDEYITGTITITDVQIFTLILCIILGIAIGVSRR